MRALSLALFFLLVAAITNLAPPALFPEWNNGNGLNSGLQASSLNVAQNWNTTMMANSWGAWTGNGGIVSIIDSALASIKLIITALSMAGVMLYDVIIIYPALYAMFPIVPSWIYISLNVGICFVYMLALMQILSARMTKGME